ncbi:MAG: acetate--CoA ligase family protein [Actinobacteria bacterium]|nr:acetate--CoA ligase family protein [Actinomycetota bacterium]
MAGRSSRSSDGGKLESGFFEPRSLAVIGASSHPGKVGYAVLENILYSGYGGGVYPVNPKGRKIQGLPSYPDIAGIPKVPDLAVIIVPAAGVPETVTECAAKGIRYGVVISAGFREAGIEGRRLEKDTVQRGRKGGVRLLGPNCLGFINSSLPLNASFARLMPPKGSIGVISQSGAICTSLLDWARDQSFGFSKLVSLGNGADLSESDFLDYLSGDDETNVIIMYVEGVSDGGRFFRSLKRATRHKPVVILKAGITQAGAQAVSSHTGALAGSDKAYEAACEQATALRADSVEELVELARSLTSQRIPKGPRVAIVTNAGGPGIIASDACEKAGLTLAGLSQRSLARLSAELPPASSLHNPVDVLGDATAERYTVAVETLLSDRGVDALIVILTPQAMTEVDRTAEEIVKISAGSHKTLICSFMGAESVEKAVSVVESAGIPNVEFPDRAVQVLARMYERSLQKEMPPSKLVRFEVDKERVKQLFEVYRKAGQIQVGPEDCRTVLGAYGIKNTPFLVATDYDQARDFAKKSGYPVALKIVSPQILHKTDVGGVVLGIKDESSLEEAYEEIMSRVRRHMPSAEIEGVGIQKMVPEGRELILGMTEDPQFGPLIMVGLGGIYVEAFQDVAFRLAPVSPADASRMLCELKAFRLLEGVRGEEPADVAAVEEVLQRVSQLAVDQPELSEMDINPLMVYNSGGGYTCVDVRMTIGG